MKLRDLLKDELTSEELSKLVTSYDVIGQIAIIEIPPELKAKEKKIGEAILHLNKNIKTVCKRIGHHSGIFRIRPVKVIAGEETTKTTYKESGVIMKLDVNKVYFTPRLSHERERIASQVKKGEVIGAWFAGVGPFPLVIAKKQPNVKIYAVELNENAFNSMQDNIRINKMQNSIKAVLGDVNEVVDDLPKFDRIIMPLPKGAENFLSKAFERANEKAVIHFYHFSNKEFPYVGFENKVKQIAKKQNKKVEIIFKRKVRPFSPSVVQVVFDILVKN